MLCLPYSMIPTWYRTQLLLKLTLFSRRSETRTRLCAEYYTYIYLYLDCAIASNILFLSLFVCWFIIAVVNAIYFCQKRENVRIFKSRSAIMFYYSYYYAARLKGRYSIFVGKKAPRAKQETTTIFGLYI